MSESWVVCDAHLSYFDTSGDGGRGRREAYRAMFHLAVAAQLHSVEIIWLYAASQGWRTMVGSRDWHHVHEFYRGGVRVDVTYKDDGSVWRVHARDRRGPFQRYIASRRDSVIELLKEGS